MIELDMYAKAMSNCATWPATVFVRIQCLCGRTMAGHESAPQASRKSVIAREQTSAAHSMADINLWSSKHYTGLLDVSQGDGRKEEVIALRLSRLGCNAWRAWLSWLRDG
jgi:hypothetical protein